MVVTHVLQPIYEKKRALEKEVADLGVSRDTSKREAEEAAEAATALETRRNGLVELINGLIEDAKDALTFLATVVERAAAVTKTATDAIGDAEAALRGLEVRIEQEGTVLAQIRQEQTDRRAEIALENDKLGIRERDVDVMRARIVRRAEELGIPANI